MIRPATPSDIPRVKELFAEMHAASKFANRVPISERALHDLLLMALGNRNRPIAGGTHFSVSTKKDRVEGFMIGLLDRVYHIGTKLVAQDMFLHVTKHGFKTDVSRLIDDYLNWADSNPNVIDINLSWTDALPGAERISNLYRRKGFMRIGGIYQRDPVRPEMEIAA